MTKHQIIGLVIYIIIDSFLEFYLGRTDRIKAASKLELLLLIFTALWELGSKLSKEKENGN